MAGNTGNDVVSHEASQSAILCDRCQFILACEPWHRGTDDRNPSDNRHHKSEDALLKAALDGCCLCQQTVQSLRTWTDDGSLPVRKRPSYYLSGRHNDSDFEHLPGDGSLAKRTWYTWCTYARSTVAGGERDYNRCEMAVHVRTPLSPPRGQQICPATFIVESIKDVDTSAAPVPHDNTGSDDCWEQCLRWLNDCQQNHRRCRSEQTGSSWYPSRLVDVGLAEESTVVIATKATSDFHGPYLTLSHCWGGDNIFKLTSSTLEQSQVGVPLSSLPRTFQEAIQITRRLKMRYIWIDSLCIQQDSAEDWEREARQMQNVYARGYLNLAATASKSSHGGLFRRRQRDSRWPWHATASFGTNDLRPCLIYSEDLRMRELEKAPLVQRAWVLQERVLCARMLHFCESQVFWECHEREACEMFPDQLPPAICATKNFLTKSLDLDTFKARYIASQSPDWGILANPPAWPYHIWNTVVSQYMGCNLTMPADKLIAISGVAKCVSAMVQDEYMAGIWRTRLPRDLLWQVEKFEQSSGAYSYRPPKYRAPSWSWASVEGAVVFDPCDFYARPTRDLVRLDDAQVTPAIAGDSFGPVVDGFVKLSGMLIGPLTLSRHETYPGFGIKTSGPEPLDHSFINPDLPPPQGTMVVVCMPIHSNDNDQGLGTVVECLLVTPAEGRSSDTYTRCGHAWFTESTLAMFDKSPAGDGFRVQLGCTLSEVEITLV